MPAWLIYGFISSLFWGTYAITSKLVTSDKYLKIDSTHSTLLMLGGVVLAFIVYFLLVSKNISPFMVVFGIAIILAVFVYVLLSLKQASLPMTFPVIGWGMLTGVLWAVGMIFTFMAFSSGAEAAKLVPIYNTNTLIAVFLGLIFLHELPAPDQRFKVISGALLIVIGSILVSR